MRKGWIYILLVLMFTLAGCNEGKEVSNTSEVTQNPKAAEFLSEHPNADLFIMKGIIYKNAEDIEWVQELDLQKGEKVYEITKQSKQADELESGSATVLPVGTKIYKTAEHHGQVYLAEINGERIRYLGLIEG